MDNKKPEDINVIGVKQKALILGEELERSDFKKFTDYVESAKQYSELYRDYIENKGYDLTIDGICDILDIPENYVQRYILKYLERIELTKTARVGLKYTENLNFNTALLDKKILVNRYSFTVYLSCNLVKFSDCIVFKYFPSDFEGYSNIKELKSKLKIFEKDLREKFADRIKYKFDFKGQQFQSIDNMKFRLGLRHNVQIFRHIEKYGFEKYIFNVNTVRYVVAEEVINKIILENKDDIIHTTKANIDIINSNIPVDERSTDELTFLIERFILNDLFGNLSLSQYRIELLNYIKENF